MACQTKKPSVLLGALEQRYEVGKLKRVLALKGVFASLQEKGANLTLSLANNFIKKGTRHIYILKQVVAGVKKNILKKLEILNSSPTEKRVPFQEQY